MTSKAERKRRRKAAKISLPGGKAVGQRMGQGRRADVQEGPPPIMAARARRCRIDAASVLHESDMGRCILALSSGQERDDLCETWAAISAAHRNYRMRIIGCTGDPKGAASPMIHDRMETDQSLRVDLRTSDERDEAARRAWDAWSGMMAAFPAPQYRWALRGALDGFMGEASLWRDGAPTACGTVAVSALKLLTERR